MSPLLLLNMCEGVYLSLMAKKVTAYHLHICVYPCVVLYGVQMSLTVVAKIQKWTPSRAIVREMESLGTNTHTHFVSPPGMINLSSQTTEEGCWTAKVHFRKRKYIFTDCLYHIDCLNSLVSYCCND